MKWVGRSATLVDSNGKTIRSRGLTKILKRHIFPGLTYNKITCKPRNPGGKCKSAAKSHGLRVDRIISEWTRGRLSLQRKPLPIEVTAFIAWCNENDLVPVRSQILVGEPKMRLATMIDICLMHIKTNVLYVVELKVGCVYRDCVVPNKTTPFVMCANVEKFSKLSFRSMYEMQALVGRDLLNRSCTVSPVPSSVECLLVFLCADGELDVTSTDDLVDNKFSVKMTRLTTTRLISTKNVKACRQRRTNRKRKR
jgi:hypothetical protein